MSQSVACLETELRKLRPAELYKLGQILSVSDSWKKLMAIIPKEGNPDCPQFNAEHFSMIEQAAQQQRRNAAEIFLAEWGTMGRERPTLRTLLNLLTKTELFRAADYLAGNILKEELPKRPKCGPAAPINISDDFIKQLEENLELQDTDFKESLIFELPVEDNNQAMNPNAMKNAMNNSSVERNMQSTKLVSIKEEQENKYLERDLNIQQNQEDVLKNQVSDFMKFSSEHNMDKCKSEVSKSIYTQSSKFEKYEMLSDELPVFVNEHKQSTEEINVKQELDSDYLPTFLNKKADELNNISHNNLTNDLLNLSSTNPNELTSFELPQCIANHGTTSTVHQNNNISMKVEENILPNVLNSEELPLTILEYKE